MTDALPVIILMSAAAWFIPGFVALARAHPQYPSICAINVLSGVLGLAAILILEWPKFAAGMMVVGWIVSLAWSVSHLSARPPPTGCPDDD